jgi:putative MFS transporter
MHVIRSHRVSADDDQHLQPGSRAVSEAADTLPAALDRSALDRKYWTVFSIASLSSIIDFFDFFIASFLLAVVAPLWQLTYGETAIVLLGGGVGSIVGSLIGGQLCDRVGRRPVVIWGSFACAISAASVAFVPDGAWLRFAMLRVLTGMSLSAVFTGIVALVVERTPTQHRTVVSTLAFVAPSAGVLLATLTSALLLDALGWRGVALLGALPLVPGLLAMALLPESIPWLISTGQGDRARELASLQLGHATDHLRIPSIERDRAQPGFRELWGHQRAFWLVSLIWLGAVAATYGVYAWGPTIVAHYQGITAQDAARLFIAVSVAGVTGKIVFAFVPRWLGRRRTGQLTTTLGALSLAFVALAPTLMPDATVFGVPMFLALLAFCTFTGEGGGGGMSPYSAEVFPVRLAARGAGLGQAAAGVGKILGPVSLGIIAGTSNLVTPQATRDAILPGLLFLAACFGLAALAYTFLGIETHGKPLQLDDRDDPAVTARAESAPQCCTRPTR